MDLVFTITELQATANKFWKTLNNKKVIAFHGQMGSGKTTFIQALCNEKQVKDAVSSPTFSIINEYESSEGVIFHIDLYRLKDLEEVIQAGVEDSLYSGSICFVEWPEIAASLFSNDTIHAYLYTIDEVTRRIRIEDNLLYLA